MSSGATLLRRVRTLERTFDPPQPARQWSVDLEEGEELSDELKAQLGPHDTVIIREHPRGYVESRSGQVMACWVDTGGGKKKPLVVYGQVCS